MLEINVKWYRILIRSNLLYRSSPVYTFASNNVHRMTKVKNVRKIIDERKVFDSWTTFDTDTREKCCPTRRIHLKFMLFNFVVVCHDAIWHFVFAGAAATVVVISRLFNYSVVVSVTRRNELHNQYFLKNSWKSKLT